MVSKLQAYINCLQIIDCRRYLKGLILIHTFLVISGCSVATTMLMPEEEKLSIMGRYEEVIQHIESPNNKLQSEHERKRVISENINLIRKNQATTSELLKYQMNQIKLVEALIEVGQMDKALKVCNSALNENQMLSAAFKNYDKKELCFSSKEFTEYTIKKLTIFKAFISWFVTGDAKQADQLFKDTIPVDLTNKKDFDSFLLRGYFFDKIIGDYNKALEQFKIVLSKTDTMSLLDYDAKFAYSLQSYRRMMSIYMKLGQLEEAKEILDKYSDTEKNLIYKVGKFLTSSNEFFRGFLSNMDSSAGAVFACLRDFKTSKEYFDKSLEIVNKIDPQSNHIWYQKALAAYYVLYGRYFLGEQNKYQDAVKYIDNGISHLKPYYLESINEEIDIETAYIYSGELHFILGTYDKAIEQTQKAIEFSKRYHNKVAGATANTLLGQIYYKKGEKQKAKQAYEKALQLAKNIESTENWKLFYGIGQVYEDLGNQSEALKYYKKAVEEVEKLWKGRFKDTQKQVSFIDNRLVVFEPVIRILAKRGKADEAVHYMERSKSRTFFETSLFDTGKGKDSTETKVTREDNEKLKKIQEEISDVSGKIDNLSEKIQTINNTLDENKKIASSRGIAGVREGKTKEKTEKKVKTLSKKEREKLEAEKKGYEKELTTYQNKLNELSEEEQKLLGATSPRLRDFGSISTLTASQIKSFIPDKTSILEYYVGERSVIGAVINRKGVYVKELPITSEWLKENVMAFRSSIENIDYGYKEQGRILYDKLITPFRKYLLDTEALCIIAHGVLHYLPFQALIAIDNSEKGISPDLIEKEKILLAALGQTQRQNRGIKGIREIKTAKVVKSDSVTTIQDKRAELEKVRLQINEEHAGKGMPEGRPMFLIDEYKIFYAPSSSILHLVHRMNSNKNTKLLAAGSPPAIDVKDLGIGQDFLEKLPSAKIEIKEVSSLFTDKSVFTGEAATKTVVKNNAPRSDILLFSTHGLLIRKDPLKSSIFFNKDQQSDGRLTVKEIESMSLSANLAVLSACETGLVSGYEGISENIYDAKFPYGDDLVGLQRAFLKSGASSVLSTLWQVADESTATLIVDFFKRFREGKDKACALQEAQLALIKSKKDYEHPYFWAPFVLSGDWR